MNRIASALAVFSFFFLGSACLVVRSKDGDGGALPFSSQYPVVRATLERMQNDLEDRELFRAETSAAYINDLANAAYEMRGDYYSPVGEKENADFLLNADETIQKVFDIRLQLNRRLVEFALAGKADSDVVRAYRRAHLYLSYASDNILARLEMLRPSESLAGRKRGGFFSYGAPRTLVNKAVFPDGEVKLQAGDLILVRGASFISATIARIGNSVSNMSHLAMVAQADDGSLKVVEALMEQNVVQYDLQDYLDLERLPRVAIYRASSELAKRFSKSAARELWRIYEDSRLRPDRYVFDLQMNLHDNGKVFCAKLARLAWVRASAGEIEIPKYLTDFSGAKTTAFARGIQMQVSSSFAPADIEIDPNFELVAEYRDVELLEESRRFDVVLSMLFERFKQGFTYRPDVTAGLQAVVAVFAKELGFDIKQVPADAKVETMATLIRHRDLVESLMSDLEKLERKEVQRLKRPLSYRELEALFDHACAGTCISDAAVQIKKQGGT